jgi:methylthioribose-1-phosphate isomerase
MTHIKSIEWLGDKVRLLDQRKLPTEAYIICEDYKSMADAIRTLAVREAPTIGVAAAMGMALGAMGIGVRTYAAFEERYQRIYDCLYATRPTAVNLPWALDRMLAVSKANADKDVPTLITMLKDEALTIRDENAAMTRKIGAYGAELFATNDHVLTHCNASMAMSVLIHAHDSGKNIHVYTDETRPLLQGSRISAWTLQQYKVPVTGITDNMAGYLMQQGRIQRIVVGADRVAANGDVANKIGTYSVAVLAKHHNVPMYVAVPCSTIDFHTQSGQEIEIEDRKAREVTHVGNVQIAPDNIDIYNPAFDVTPANFITAMITDKGVAEPPFERTLQSFA